MTLARVARLIGSAAAALPMIVVIPAALADVDPTGEFRNEVVIRVPPYHGIEPSVTLSYRSRGGNSFVGVGWNINAVSAIDRVSAFNGVARFDDTDKYVLDGTELIPCPPGAEPASSPSCTTARQAFGSSANFYSTRWESFVRIQKDAPSPNQWTLWRKNGTKVIYTHLQATARATVRWAVASEEDTHGNQVVYNYWCETRPLPPLGRGNQSQCYPGDIQYGTVAGTNLRATLVRFNWELRPDPWSYANGRLVTVNYRLNNIEVLRRQPDGALAVVSM